MHFAIQKDALVKALKDVSSAIATRVVQPILSNVLIESIDDVTLRFTATDLDLAIQTKCPAVVYKPGAVTLPGKKLLEVVAKLPNDLVTIQVTPEHETAVTCQRSKFNISGLAAEDFPKVLDSRSSDGLVMPSEVLKRAIAQTAFAAAGYDAASILGGVYLLLSDGSFEATATDASRLAHRKDTLNVSSPAARRESEKEAEGGVTSTTATMDRPVTLKAIVPARACAELTKLLDVKESPEVRIAMLSGQITFETDSHYLSTRLIGGEYPRYQELFPANYTHLAHFEREALMSVVERVAVMSDERTHLINLHFDGETLKVSSNTPDVGRAQDEVPMRYEGEALDVAVNVRYVVEVLQKLTSAEVRLEMTGSLKPLIFKGDNDENYRYLLMPVQSKTK
ncbi:MAG: DNA polymerase III subunit beta [Candidatus Obscuribacterales bacterium]|nr:DNA polymerase III subunit beta [Candidatus Obscuribacterales bacterium]